MAKWYERAARGVGGSIVGGGVGLPMLGTARGAMWDETNDWNNARGTDIEDWYDEQGGKWYDPGDLLGNKAAEDAREDVQKAMEDQTSSLDKATQLQSDMYYQGREDMMPWLTAGTEGLGNLQRAMSSGQFNTPIGQFDSSQYQMPTGPAAMDDFSFTMDDFQDSPYYQFLQDEGAKNVNRSAAAQGALGGGDTLNALQNRGQMTAMGEYGNQYNRALGGYGANMNKHQMDLGRYQTDIGAMQANRGFDYGAFHDDYNRRLGGNRENFNRMASMADVGQVQGTNMSGMGQKYGQQIGENFQNRSNALAAGRIGMGNINAQQQANKQGLVGGVLKGIFS